VRRPGVPARSAPTYEESLLPLRPTSPTSRPGLVNFTELASGTEFAVFQSAVDSGGAIEGLVVPGGAGFSRKEIDDLTETVKQLGAKGLVSIAFSADPATASEEEVRSPVLRHLGLERARRFGAHAGANAGDLLLIVAGVGGIGMKEAGSVHRVRPALDALRRTLAAKLDLADPNTLQFFFVVDFPLVEWNEDERRCDSTTCSPR
jgi:aspartyl-tRNA synthetase